MLDQRSYKLFEEITKYEHITKLELMRQLNLTERQFNYDLEKVNHMLINLGKPQIEISNQVITIAPELRNMEKSDVRLDFNVNSFAISEENRIILIYLFTFIRQEPVSNYHYQSLLGVSKNTALSDVKRIKEMCKDWKIEFVYSRVDGYHLEGTEMDKRRFASYCIDYLLSQSLGKEMIILVLRAWQQDDRLLFVKKIIDEFLVENTIQLVKSRKTKAIYNLVLVMIRNKSEGLHFHELEKQLLQRQSLYKKGKILAKQLFPNAVENESYFVTIHLLISLENLNDTDNPIIEKLAGQIIDEFERNTLLPIENKEFLKESLYNHLVPAFFRITFEIPLVSTLTERIKKDYAELFQFVKRSLAPLSMWTGKEISEHEIGYFTLHFGGYLENGKKHDSKKLNALIVCSKGISTSIMLSAQLKEMFPDIHFLKVHTVDQVSDIPYTSYDLIFSTVNIISDKPMFLVKPLMSEVEKNYLIQAVTTEFPRLHGGQISVNQVMAIIKKHADIRDENKLYSELVNLYQKNAIEEGVYQPMLSELLTKDMIHITDEKLEWRDAISKAAQPLVDSNKVQQKYVDAMIKNVEEIGTYIHIGKGIAIPHARPESGVNNIGMSLLRTKSPVFLLDQEEHKIDVFICLAAIDSEAHLKALAQLTKLLGNDSTLQAIKAAENAEQIIEIIKNEEEQE